MCDVCACLADICINLIQYYFFCVVFFHSLGVLFFSFSFEKHFSQTHDNVIDVAVVVVGLDTEELKIFKTKYPKKSRAIQCYACSFCTAVYTQWAMCVFRHARLIMREICTMPVPFYTHTYTSHIFIWIFFSLYPGFFPRSILLFNELNKKKPTTMFWTFRRLFVFTLYSSSRWNFIVVSWFFLFSLFIQSFHLVWELLSLSISHRLNVPFGHR